MNASNAGEMCDSTPILSPEVYKNDGASNEEEILSNEPELFRIVATILVFVAWVYLIVKGYLDYEANRAEVPDDGSRNEVEGDRRLNELFNNNANDLETNPVAAANAFGPFQQATADMPPAPTESRENDGAPVTRQAAPPTERRRRQRSTDVRGVELLAAFDLDEASPAAAAEDSTAAAESVQAAASPDIDGAVKPKKALRHVRKYVRAQKPEDNRSKEPETSDEDLVQSYESRTKTNSPTDESQRKGAAAFSVVRPIPNANTSVAETLQVTDAGRVVRPIPNANTSVAETLQVTDAESVAGGSGTDMQSAANLRLPSDHLEDSHVIPSNQQPLENDPDPSCGRCTRGNCLKQTAFLNRHGTRLDEDLTAEARAKTESKVLGAVKYDDSRASVVTRPASQGIIDCLNANLLEQLTTDLIRRLQEQAISEERLRQELDVQMKARHEAQRCYSEVVKQVRRFGIEWGSARPGKQTEEKELDEQRNIETTKLEATLDKTDCISRPTDTKP